MRNSFNEFVTQDKLPPSTPGATAPKTDMFKEENVPFISEHSESVGGE